MTREHLGAAVLLALCAASALAYARDHRQRRYARGRQAQPSSVRAFAVAYAWIRVSTPVAGLVAVLGGGLSVRPPAAVFWSGLALALSGLALFAHARRALGRQYAPCYDAYLPTAIVVHGAYRYVRHPIYTANLAQLLGLTLVTGSLVLALNTALLAAFCVVSAAREETTLAAASLVYRSYRRTTGRFLPRLRPAA